MDVCRDMGCKFESEVSIEIVDINGRLLKNLVQKSNHSKGYYSVVWNADMYSSGVYFVRLTTDSEVRNNKIMLIK